MISWQVHDEAARRSLADAQRAVWAEADWEAGVEVCCEIVRTAAGHLAPGGRMLDFGCGVGRMIPPLMHAYAPAKVVGFDPAPMMLVRADEYLTSLDVPVCTGKRPGVELIDRWTSIVGMFDLTYSLCVFQHLPVVEQEGALDALWRRVSSGGVLVVQTVWGADPGPMSNNWLPEIAGVESERWMGVRYPTWCVSTWRKA